MICWLSGISNVLSLSYDLDSTPIRKDSPSGRGPIVRLAQYESPFLI